MADEPAIPVDGPRAGARVLTLLATPLNLRLLHAHVRGSTHSHGLHGETAWPAQTTMRNALRDLRELGALRLSPEQPAQGSAHELAPAGDALLMVGRSLTPWLREAPFDPIEAESTAAKAAIKALAEGWSSTVAREVALRPASLSELAKRIPGLSPSSVERRLVKMRETGQVAPVPDAAGRGKPYQPTRWLRRAVAPLVMAIRCESRFFAHETLPLLEPDVEAIFMLSLPLLKLPRDVNGSVALSMRIGLGSGNGHLREAGATIDFRGGKVDGLAPGIREKDMTRVQGDVEDWLKSLVSGGDAGLEYSGEHVELGETIVAKLGEALFE